MIPALDVRNRVALAAVLLAEYALFRQYALRELVWSYPGGFDQVQYLSDSYATYETILLHGLWDGLRRAAALHAPQGFLLHLETGLLSLLLGPGRLTALTVNFLHFAAFQWALVHTLRWLTGGWTVPRLALGLLLCLTSPYFWVGGLMDFRLDFGAMCLYGIFLCTVVRSRLLATTRGALLAGLAGAVCGLFRYVAGIYVLGTLAVLGAASWAMRRRGTSGGPARIPARGVLLAAGVVIGTMGPALWASRHSLETYYVEGHIRSPEKTIRAQEQGVGSGLRAVAFYPRTLAEHHLGSRFAVLAALALAVAAAGGIARRSPERDAEEGPPVEAGALCLFLAASVLVPLGVLSLAPSKSLVVVSIVLPGVVWLVAMAFWRGACRPGHHGLARAAAAVAVVVLVAGLWTQAEAQSTGTRSRNPTPAAEVVRLYDTMAEIALRQGWYRVAASANGISETLYVRLLTPVAYERRGRYLPTEVFLGDAMAPVDLPMVLDRLERSHFVLFTVRPPSATSPFPFDASMRALHGAIGDFCESRLVPVDRFGFPEGEVVLYERPEVKVEGGSGAWITSDGLTLVGEGRVFGRYPVLELRGPVNVEWLGGRLPRAQATLQVPASRLPIPTSVRASDAGDEYVLRLEVDPALVATQPEVRLRITFDTHFVPSRLGLNDDTRELVMSVPQAQRFYGPTKGPRD